jgi:5-(carboxyamino)imidazole ribonucleotide synthase
MVVKTNRPLLRGKTIVCAGDGELVMMASDYFWRLGYRFMGVGLSPNGPLAHTMDDIIVVSQAEFESMCLVNRLPRDLAAFCLEIESIHPGVLDILHERGVRVSPSAETLATVQDRLHQKQALERKGIPIAPFRSVGSADEAEQMFLELGEKPCLLKTRRGGYNGSGQRRITNAHEARLAWIELGSVPCVLELELNVRCELCVMVARHPDGTHAIYDPALTYHTDGIMKWAVARAPLPPKICEDAQALALAAAEALDTHMAGIELFVVGEQLYVNECAARVHNGGHFTRSNCLTPQFEQWARIVTGHPLAPTTLLYPTAMWNLLAGMPGGPETFDPSRLIGVDCWYHKQARARRKMGHLLRSGPTPFKALISVARAYDALIGGVAAHRAHDIETYFKQRELIMAA